MDIKLYVQFENQEKEELEEQIVLLDDLAEMFGIKEVTVNGKKVLAREELKDRRYTYHLQEPLGGKTLLKWMDDGKRLDLWVAHGETKNMGRRRVFSAVETHMIKNLMPHTRVLSRNNQVVLALDTLERPVRQDGAA